MTRRLVRERFAERDLLEQVAYIARDNSVAALRYLDAAETAFNRLVETPDIGSLWDFEDPRLTGIRAWSIPGFRNYLIFYRVTDDEIQVLRVLHGARDIEQVFRSRS